MDEKIMITLSKLGFTEYEAKVYIAIIQLNLSSAKEIIDLSEVPRGKIYSTLNQLVEKGYIGEKKGNPALYYPINPVEIIVILKKQLIEDLSVIEEYIIDINKRNSWVPSLFWEMPTDSNLENKFHNLLKTVEKDILIIFKEPEIYSLLEEKLLKIRKKVKITVIVPKDLMYRENKFHLYQISDELNKYLDYMENSYSDHFSKPMIVLMMLIDGKRGVIIIKNSQELKVGISYNSIFMYTQKKVVEMLSPEILR